MVVTINTDAAYNQDYKVGAYAYWIVYNGVRIKKAGILKDCETSQEAETKAIANALYKITHVGWTEVFLIIINTDCKNAIDFIKVEMVPKREALKKVIEAIHKYIDEIRVANNVRKTIVEYVDLRHVKAHTLATDKRSYVNDWCDRSAKEMLRRHITTLQQQNRNSQ